MYLEVKLANKHVKYNIHGLIVKSMMEGFSEDAEMHTIFPE